jgi:NADP-dependent 3-hydroxy acid dehydrogenase YdfG
MILKDKVAVIYGAGGGIGGAVAGTFAREGAKLFLTGRHLAPVEAVAKDIVLAGGWAEAAEVDALDEQAVDKHLQSVIDKAGRVNISFNAVGMRWFHVHSLTHSVLAASSTSNADILRFLMAIIPYRGFFRK